MVINPEFCEKCGSRLSPGVNFCERCGAPVPVRPAAGVSPGDWGAGDVCPKCRKGDRVLKVPEIYQRDNISVENYSVWSRAGADQQGEAGEGGPAKEVPPSLAQKLAPPEEPKYRSRVASWAIIPFIPIVNALTIWFAPMPWKMKAALIINGVLLIIAAIVSSRVEKQIWESKSAYYTAVEQLTHVGPFTVLDAPYIFGFIVLVTYYWGLFMESLRRKKHFNSDLMPAYQKAMARWRNLFYCARCGGVFTSSPPPGRAGFVPAGSMNSLLYDKMPGENQEID